MTEMLPEAAENFFQRKMKVIGPYDIQLAIFQQILIDQWYVSLSSLQLQYTSTQYGYDIIAIQSHA